MFTRFYYICFIHIDYFNIWTTFYLNFTTSIVFEELPSSSIFAFVTPIYLFAVVITHNI